MVCAITGASGYVGSNLKTALGRHFEVVPITRKPSPDSIQWELGQTSDITQQLHDRNVKTLIHAAWDFGNPDPKQNERINVRGSQRLFEAAERAGVERIVFVSTISAFTAARSMYGQSKMRVEQMVLDRPGGAVVRPGLVWGAESGGMFGALAKQVNQGKLIPLIGSGRYPQYLVHEEDLGNAIVRAATGDWTCNAPVTVANPNPWLLRDLILTIGRNHGRKVTLLPVPWPAIYAGLKTAELAGLKLGFRSDSVLSLVYQDPAPDFAPADQLGLQRRAFTGNAKE